MTTRRERLERKLEKRREWAESRKAKAEQEWEKGDLSEEKSGIPLGQPILVGHHSERRHRNVIDRAHRAMDRAVENEKMAEHHESKAGGLANMLNTTIFSDDEDATERLQEKISAMEEERKKNNTVNRIIRKAPRGKETPEKVEALQDLLGLSESTAKKLLTPDFCGQVGIPSYVNSNLGGRIRNAKKRLESIKIRQMLLGRAAATEEGYIIRRSLSADYCSVTFAEKPERSTISDIKAAGFRWDGVSWYGQTSRLPECLTEEV